jgi:uncharacterized protein YecT (DUF1311 family)
MAALFGLASCNASEAQGTSAQGDGLCGEFGAHAEEIACRDAIAAKSRKEMLAALATNAKNAAAAQADYDSSVKDQTIKVPTLPARLNASQAAWEKYAQAQCDYEAGKSFGGSGGWDFEAKCEDRLNRQRLSELNGLLAWDRDNKLIDSGK